MSKYIPADKLIAEIEKQQRRLTVLSLKGSVDVRRDSALQGGVYDYILGIITSLQQEQSETDVVSTAKVFLDALSKTPYNNKPITDAQIIVRQLLLFFENPKEYNPDAILGQPEVDLDREVIKYKVPFTDESEYLNETTLDAIAHHFAEWGATHLNARKEENK